MRWHRGTGWSGWRSRWGGWRSRWGGWRSCWSGWRSRWSRRWPRWSRRHARWSAGRLPVTCQRAHGRCPTVRRHSVRRNRWSRALPLRQCRRRRFREGELLHARRIPALHAQQCHLPGRPSPQRGRSLVASPAATTHMLLRNNRATIIACTTTAIQLWQAQRGVVGATDGPSQPFFLQHAGPSVAQRRVGRRTRGAIRAMRLSV